jgi:hypothetical protein
VLDVLQHAIDGGSHFVVGFAAGSGGATGFQAIDHPELLADWELMYVVWRPGGPVGTIVERTINKNQAQGENRGIERYPAGNASIARRVGCIVNEHLLNSRDGAPSGQMPPPATRC